MVEPLRGMKEGPDWDGLGFDFFRPEQPDDLEPSVAIAALHTGLLAQEETRLDRVRRHSSENWASSRVSVLG